MAFLSLLPSHTSHSNSSTKYNLFLHKLLTHVLLLDTRISLPALIMNTQPPNHRQKMAKRQASDGGDATTRPRPRKKQAVTKTHSAATKAL